MTIEDRMQGDWLCLVGDQTWDEAYRLMIDGGRCVLDGDEAEIKWRGDEASVRFADGAILIINRESLAPVNDSRGGDDPSVPIVLDLGGGA